MFYYYEIETLNRTDSYGISQIFSQINIQNKNLKRL